MGKIRNMAVNGFIVVADRVVLVEVGELQEHARRPPIFRPRFYVTPNQYAKENGQIELRHLQRAVWALHQFRNGLITRTPYYVGFTGETITPVTDPDLLSVIQRAIN